MGMPSPISGLQDLPPCRLMVQYDVAEGIVEQQVGQFKVSFKDRCNLI